MTCVFFSCIFCKPQEVLGHRSVRSVIQMYPRIMSRLQRLGLYQVAMLGNINVDPNLIAGLVERWRSECHCFNFNFGEMTVTLEDVSCLWGLSIQGELITVTLECHCFNFNLHNFMGPTNCTPFFQFFHHSI